MAPVNSHACAKENWERLPRVQALGVKPTHFAVLKYFVFQQKLKPKYAENTLLFFENSCKNRQEPQK